MQHEGSTNKTYADCQQRVALAFVALRRLYPDIPFTWGTLNRDDVRIIIKHLEQTFSEATVATTVDAMSSLYAFVNKEFAQLSGGNPWQGQKFRRPVDATSERILSEDEIRRIIQAADSFRDKTYLRFLYYSGCRVSESVTVTWRQIRRSDRDGGGGCARYFANVIGKGHKARVVEIPGDVMHDMIRLGKGKIKPDDRVWAFSQVWAWELVHKATVAAGIKKNVSPHWMRHANASHALRRGANIADVQDTLGHARITTTQKYLHADPQVRTAQFLPKV
jgi:integrase/recombinase XerD